jgi:hypothetical protein
VSIEHESDHLPAPPNDDAPDEPRPRPLAREPHFVAGRVACPRCKAHNDARAAFCAVCGELLPPGLPRLREPEERFSTGGSGGATGRR